MYLCAILTRFPLKKIILFTLYNYSNLQNVIVFHMACGAKSGQTLYNRVTDASIRNIYIKYRLKLIENELGHTFEFESAKKSENSI